MAAVAWAGLTGCSRDKAQANAPSAKNLPNILIYVSDTLRADALGCYGNKNIDTPTLDGLAAKGVLFEQAIAPSPWTRASMASILTGLYPSAHKADGRKSVLPEVPRLSEYLQKAGYQTGNFTTNPNTAAVFGFKPGFDHFEEFGERRKANRVKANELTVPSEQLHEKIVSWVQELDPSKPFFAYVLSIDPHAPYKPPAEFDRYGDPSYAGPINPGADEKMLNRQELTPADKARVVSLYHGDTAYNDHTLGQLLDQLAKMGRGDNTIVIFTADHGEEFWEHGQRGHGKALFVESLHVPLIWYDPQNPQRGQRISRQVSSIDIVPTIMERLQLDRPKHLQGISLFDSTIADRKIYSELNLDGHQLTAVHQHPWKMIFNTENDREYMFNAESDGVERKNLAKVESETRARLRQWIDGHRQQSPHLGTLLAQGRIDIDESQITEEQRSELGGLGYTGWDDDENSDHRKNGADDDSPRKRRRPQAEEADAVDDHDHDDEAGANVNDGVEDVSTANDTNPASPAQPESNAGTAGDSDHG